MLTPVLPIEISYLELRISQYNQLGGPCDFSVSPSPFGLDFGTLDFGLGLDKN